VLRSKYGAATFQNAAEHEELNAVVQNEPADWVDPDTVGLYAAIGIRKGQPFTPDARMKKVLTDSVAVGNAIARSDLFASRDPRTRIYRDRQWVTPFVGGSYQFLEGTERLLDARAMFFYYATGITPAMTEAKPGTGSAYAGGFRDTAGNYLDGGRTYALTLPGPTRAELLGPHGLRQPNPLAPSYRPEACRCRQHASGDPEESGRWRHHLVRT
jgi:hypothetical protein